MPPRHLRLGSSSLNKQFAPAREAWSPVFVGDGLCLLYGPRLGRFYLLAQEDALNPLFLRIIGLTEDARHDQIVDPANRIASTRLDFGSVARKSALWRWRLAYRALRISRYVMPFRLTARLVRFLACSVRHYPQLEGIGVSIALRLHTIELALGVGDCYPRALMTAFWSLAAGRRCILTIGALVPTRKMHVWCTVDSVIPYEPSPEHYLYQPLWTVMLQP